MPNKSIKNEIDKTNIRIKQFDAIRQEIILSIESLYKTMTIFYGASFVLIGTSFIYDKHEIFLLIPFMIFFAHMNMHRCDFWITKFGKYILEYIENPINSEADEILIGWEKYIGEILDKENVVTAPFLFSRLIFFNFMFIITAIEGLLWLNTEKRMNYLLWFILIYLVLYIISIYSHYRISKSRGLKGSKVFFSPD